MFGWVEHAETGAFLGLGHFRPLAIALGVVMVVGLALALTTEAPRALLARIAAPLALFGGSLAFAVMTAYGRSWRGEEAARASRYLHITVALTLPLLAVAADALIRRRRALAPLVLALFIVPIAWNARGFDDEYPLEYFRHTEQVARASVRQEYAGLPRDLRPLVDTDVVRDVTLGFLRDLADDDRLVAARHPGAGVLGDELSIRLGLLQTERGEPTGCRTFDQPQVVVTQAGDVVEFTTPLSIERANTLVPVTRPVDYDPVYGRALTVTTNGLELRIRPVRGAPTFVLCGAAAT
jgi:hypothetical protein